MTRRCAYSATLLLLIAYGQPNQYAVILQKASLWMASTHWACRIIVQQSNKEAIDFWASTFLSLIFFVDTQVHNPLSTRRRLHNAISAPMVWSLASYSHLPLPALTTDRISRLAIHRKRSIQLKTSPTAFPNPHLQQHSPSWVASRSDSAAAVVPTSTGGAATTATAAAVLLAALLAAPLATDTALVVTAHLP